MSKPKITGTLNPIRYKGVKVVLTIHRNFVFSIFIASGLELSGSSAHATPRVIQPKLAMVTRTKKSRQWTRGPKNRPRV